MTKENSNVISLTYANKIPVNTRHKQPNLTHELNKAYDAIRNISDELIRNELHQHWRRLVSRHLRKMDAEYDLGGVL